MNVFSWSVVLMVLSAVITFAACYTLLYLKHDIPDHVIVAFLSTSIAFPYESCIGTLGLVVGGIFAGCAMIGKHAIVKHAYATFLPDKRIEGKAKWSLLIGLAAVLMLIGVASFQEFIIRVVHLMFAMSFFSLTCVYMAFMTKIDYDLYKNTRTTMKIVYWRMGFCLAALTGTLGFIGFIIAFKSSHPIDYYFRDASAVCEIFTAMCFFGYFSTFIYEFRNAQITFTVKGGGALPAANKHALLTRDFFQNDGEFGV